MTAEQPRNKNVGAETHLKHEKHRVARETMRL
jgi:hypothetical protein